MDEHLNQILQVFHHDYMSPDIDEFETITRNMHQYETQLIQLEYEDESDSIYEYQNQMLLKLIQFDYVEVSR